MSIMKILNNYIIEFRYRDGDKGEKLRIWFKIIKNNRLLQDTTITDESKETRTHKIFGALEQACYEFDLSRPIWLEANIKEFKRNAKTRFRQENFVEQIEFDFLEMDILEED